MTREGEEFERLKELCPTAQLFREAGHPVVLLPKLRFRGAGEAQEMDAVLHPEPHTGYPTRLFFENEISGVGQNWNSFQLLGRSWWACSWGDVEANLDWVSILAAHLRAVA